MKVESSVTQEKENEPTWADKTTGMGNTVLVLLVLAGVLAFIFISLLFVSQTFKVTDVQEQQASKNGPSDATREQYSPSPVPAEADILGSAGKYVLRFDESRSYANWPRERAFRINIWTSFDWAGEYVEGGDFHYYSQREREFMKVFLNSYPQVICLPMAKMPISDNEQSRYKGFLKYDSLVHSSKPVVGMWRSYDLGDIVAAKKGVGLYVAGPNLVRAEKVENGTPSISELCTVEVEAEVRTDAINFVLVMVFAGAASDDGMASLLRALHYRYCVGPTSRVVIVLTGTQTLVQTMHLALEKAMEAPQQKENPLLLCADKHYVFKRGGGANRMSVFISAALRPNYFAFSGLDEVESAGTKLGAVSALRTLLLTE